MRPLAALACLPFVGTTFLPAPARFPAREEVRLAWKFQSGEVLRYRVLQETHQTMSGMGTMETDSNIGQVLREKVLSVAEDGTAKLECTFEALKLHITIPMVGDMEFDSTRGDSAGTLPEALQGLAKLPGSIFRMEMRPTGEIVSLSGMTEIVEKLAASTDPKTSMISSMITRSFTDESMKRALETTLLPEKPVAPGETWKRQSEFTLPSMGKLKAQFDFKLAGVEDLAGTPCAKIGVDNELTLEGKPDLSENPMAQGFDIDLVLDEAQGQGTIHFSPEKGRMIQTRLATDMDMKMTMKPKGGGEKDAGEGMKMSIRISTHLTTSLLGPDEAAFAPEAKKETPSRK